VLDKGARNVEILKQANASPLRVEQQIAIIYLGTKNLLRNVPVNRVREFEKEFLDVCERKNKEQLDALKAGKFDDAITGALEATAKELSAKYN
jgi:F-type H+/Na+-transporting ATPase subunit alpha